MKSVLISIKPKWCGLIASGKKTIEVRKTKPKLKTPFKCYIYCTKDKDISFWTGKSYSYSDDRSHNAFDKCGNGKIIGEFMCDKIINITCGVDDYERFWHETRDEDCDEPQMCLSWDELSKYLGRGNGYGWHISDLFIYDMPKELSEFYRKDFETIYSQWEDLFSIGVKGIDSVEYPPEPKEEDYRITRPPMSWCYAEECV